MLDPHERLDWDEALGPLGRGLDLEPDLLARGEVGEAAVSAASEDRLDPGAVRAGGRSADRARPERRAGRRDPRGRRAASRGSPPGCCASRRSCVRRVRRRCGTSALLVRPGPFGRRSSPSTARRSGVPWPGSLARAGSSRAPTPHLLASAATAARLPATAGSGQAGSATGSQSGPETESHRPSAASGRGGRATAMRRVEQILDQVPLGVGQLDERGHEQEGAAGP